MRRKDKEIVDRTLIDRIIDRADVCRVAFCDGNIPYIVPMNFGYRDDCLYFHCAREGRKIEMLKKNENVCFEMDIEHELVKNEKPCEWGMKYYSVIGFGKAELVEGNDEKRKALDIIMSRYSDSKSFEYPENILNNVKIIKVSITEISGKKSGY
jgi:hypothetical protein